MDIKWESSGSTTNNSNNKCTVTKQNENYKELIIIIKTLKQIHREIYYKQDELQGYIETLQAEEKHLTDGLCYHIIRDIKPLIDSTQNIITKLYQIKENIKYDIDINKQEKEESINNKTFVMDGQDLLDALRVTKTNPININDNIIRRKNNDDNNNPKNYDEFVNIEEERILRESYPHNINNMKKKNNKKKGANNKPKK